MSDPSDNGAEQAPEMLGRVSTSLATESSQDDFYFWVDRRRLVEATQIIRVSMPLPAEDPRVKRLKKPEITVIGFVETVKRQSEAKTVGSDHDRYDGQADQEPVLPPAGFGYAYCKVIDVEPTLFVPLQEGLPVFLATEQEAGRGYGYPQMVEAKSDLTVGVLQNGGSQAAGAAKLDTRYLLGDYGGHINVTGVAGTGTKTSFLMVVVKMLLLHARKVTLEHPENPLVITPVVFNVKGTDLMWLDQPNRRFDPNADDWKIYRDNWEKGLFDDFAQPFKKATFLSYPVKDGPRAGLPAGVTLYSWGLKDVIDWGAEKYLVSAESRSNELLAGVLEDAFQCISRGARIT
jgi:hypothetical protein